MADYDNNLRGVLFPNVKAKDTQPDYKGSCEIDGQEYWLSGWKKLSKDNKPFLSLAFTHKESQEVPVVGTITDDGKINYDNITDEDLLNSIPF